MWASGARTAVPLSQNNTASSSMAQQPQGTPRVNKELLPSFVGQAVRIVGRVTNLGHGTFDIQTLDNGSVKVRIPPQQQGEEIVVNQVVEVIGKVVDGQTVDEFTFTPLPEDVSPIDFEVHNNALILAHNYPAVFGWPQ